MFRSKAKGGFDGVASVIDKYRELSTRLARKSHVAIRSVCTQTKDRSTKHDSIILTPRVWYFPERVSGPTSLVGN